MIDDEHKNIDYKTELVSKANSQALEALLAIGSIKKDFRPVLQRTPGDSDQTKQIWETAEKIAWGLRVADSEGNTELRDKIKEEINKYPEIGYFVIYQLMTDSFERAEEVAKYYPTKPLSAELREYSTKTIKSKLENTQDPIELQMFQQIASRVIYGEGGLPINGTTYLGVNEIKDINEVLNSRQAGNDPLFKRSETLNTMQALNEISKKLTPVILQ